MEILFLAHRSPDPPDRGDRIRASNVLRYLQARATVHVVAFGEPRPRWRAGLAALATRKPVSLTSFSDRATRRAVEQLLATRPINAIYVFSSQMAQYVPASFAGCVVMDFVDVDSQKFADYARAAHGPRRWLYAREARRLLAHDRAVARRADASLFVSAAEAALFRSLGGEGAIHVVENGIDTERFDPAARFERVSSPTPLIVFTGQMDYPPNVEAATWFAHDILPAVRRFHPTAAFAVVGRAPTAEICALSRIDGVIVTGEVPDVRGWLAAASVAVAPLKLARGVQNKVLEAMAMARPVVASTAAAEGIDDAHTLRIGGDASEIADRVIGLLDDPIAADALGEAARRRVRVRYGWEARLAPLDTILGLPPHGCEAAA